MFPSNLTKCRALLVSFDEKCFFWRHLTNRPQVKQLRLTLAESVEAKHKVDTDLQDLKEKNEQLVQQVIEVTRNSRVTGVSGPYSSVILVGLGLLYPKCLVCAGPGSWM